MKFSSLECGCVHIYAYTTNLIQRKQLQRQKQDIFKTEKGNTTQKESPKSFNQSNNINHKPKNLNSEENPPRAKELVLQKCNNNEKVK